MQKVSSFLLIPELQTVRRGAHSAQAETQGEHSLLAISIIMKHTTEKLTSLHCNICFPFTEVLREKINQYNAAVITIQEGATINGLN